MNRFVWLEIACVVAACVLPLPIPAVVPLVVVASVSLWLRKRSWGDVSRGPRLYAVLGAAAGVLALGSALLLGTPAIEHISDYAVQWSTNPIVRGNAMAFALVALVTIVTTVAGELVVRGWIVDRALELRASPSVAIAIGAFADALLIDGPIAVRIGAGVFGLGLGWLYVAAGRSVVAPICARLAFALGALTLEALRVVG